MSEASNFLSSEEEKKILEAFNALKLKPKSDTPQEFAQWMTDFFRSSEPQSTPQPILAAGPEPKFEFPKGHVHHHLPKPHLSGDEENPPPCTPKVECHGEDDTIPKRPPSPTDYTPTPVRPERLSSLLHTALPSVVSVKQSPRISVFYGNDSSKGESTYDQWRYEVKCLLLENNYDIDTIAQAIRRSLKGEASRIAMRLGPTASIHAILEKFDSVYGTVEVKESILARFYSAKQRDCESVSAWGCRLEEIVGQAVELGQVKTEDVNTMLRSMFYTGMKKSLKDISGHKYDTIHDFDQLRMAVRRLELDQNPTDSLPKTATTKTDKKKENSDDIGQLKGMVKQLTADVNSLKQSKTPPQPPTRTSSIGRAQPQKWDRDRSYQHKGHYGNNTTTDRQATTTYGQQGHNRPQSRPPTQSDYVPNDRQPDYTEDGDPICWKCGQIGHLSYGCRVRLDHLHKPLNGSRPMGRGHP